MKSRIPTPSTLIGANFLVDNWDIPLLLYFLVDWIAKCARSRRKCVVKVVYPRRGYFMIIQKGVIKLEEEIASNLEWRIVGKSSSSWFTYWRTRSCAIKSPFQFKSLVATFTNYGSSFIYELHSTKYTNLTHFWSWVVYLGSGLKAGLLIEMGSSFCWCWANSWSQAMSAWSRISTASP